MFKNSLDTLMSSRITGNGNRSHWRACDIGRASACLCHDWFSRPWRKSHTKKAAFRSRPNDERLWSTSNLSATTLGPSGHLYPFLFDQ